VKDYEDNGDLLVDLGSDQTSLHNPYNGGYYPAGLTFDESQQLMKNDSTKFKEEVKNTYDFFALLILFFGVKLCLLKVCLNCV